MLSSSGAETIFPVFIAAALEHIEFILPENTDYGVGVLHVGIIVHRNFKLVISG